MGSFSLTQKWAYSIVMLLLFFGLNVHSQENNIVEDSPERLVMTISLFSEGINIPNSEIFMERNWVQRIGTGNLNARGKEQLKDLGLQEGCNILSRGKTFTQRDVALYSQDRNISIVGAYSYLQGLFLTTEKSCKAAGLQQQSKEGPFHNPTPNQVTSKMNTTVSESISDLDEPGESSFMDVPIVTNHYKYDPVLMVFGPACPNIQIERERFSDQILYKDVTKKYAVFLSGLNKKIFQQTQIELDSLKRAATLYEFLRAELLITGSSEISLDPYDMGQLRDIHSFVRYYEHFFDVKILRSGAALLLQQITKDFSEKIGAKKIQMDGEKESLLRNNIDRLVVGYSVGSNILGNILVAFNLTSAECEEFTDKPARGKCLEWPGYNNQIRFELVQNSATSEYSVKFTYMNSTIKLNKNGKNPDLLPVKEFFALLKNSTLENFNSFCGAEWLIGKKVVQTFMGLVFFNILIILLLVMMLVIIFFLKSKINSLKCAKELTELEEKKAGEHHFHQDQL